MLKLTIHKNNALIIMMVVCTCIGPRLLQAQSPQYSPSASVVVQADGSVSVISNSPRPVYQAATAIAEKYGVIIDYEDPAYVPSQIYIAGDERRLRGGTFSVLLPPMKDHASEATALQFLLTAFRKEQGIPFKLITHHADDRLDIVGLNPGNDSLLDTSILLKPQLRTINETVNEILKLIASRRGTTVTRGGFIDSGMDIQVKIGGQHEQPAREWLAQALDACPDARTWVLAYEPSDGNFYFSVQNAMGMTDGRLQPIHQSTRHGQ